MAESMTTLVTIRAANREEYLKFHAICDNDQPHPLSLDERLAQRRLEFEQIAEGKRIILFAEADGQVVGSVQLRPGRKTPGEGLVHALVVRRDFRRRGIGTRLMDAAEAEARKRGYRRVWLRVHAGNEAARQLYAKLGYGETGTPVSADQDAMIEMEKWITAGETT